MAMERNKTVMVVGGGGRCHAIVAALARSPQVERIYCAPGNAGIAELAECVPLSVTDVEGLADFAASHNVDLTVVGPEAALAAGLVDVFTARGLRAFGPTKSAARIESSKEFAKELMMKHSIPTATYKSFDDFDEAWAYVKSRPLPAVVKYDGLAAGKGVVVAATYEEAEAALRDMLLDSAFGKGRVVVEDFLDGPEFSFMCVVGGRKVYPLALAQDHKRAFEGDSGPNTGGMGAYSPVDFITAEVRDRALTDIMQATADALADEGVPFYGVLYGGLILTDEGPKVIEFNARFGDPETEVVLPRLESDIYALFTAALEGKDFPLEWSSRCYLGIVLAADGYPGSYPKGFRLEDVEKSACGVYHMGTARDTDGNLVSAGGRVLMVVGSGSDMKAAREAALADAERIAAGGSLFFRRDIGHKVIDI